MGDINQIDSLGRRQGLWVWCDANGNVEEKINYLNGLFHGDFVYFYKNGNIGDKCNYFMDNLIDYSQDFRKNGSLRKDIFYHIIF